VPVRLESSTNPELARRLSLHWTPTLTVLHPRGTTVRQWIGFLPPDAFVVELELALAVAELRSANPDAAAARLSALDVPEALYWKGIATYRRTRDKAALWDVWHELARRHPESPWAQRTTLLQPDWVEHPVET
jgi:hypothetical protein